MFPDTNPRPTSPRRRLPPRPVEQIYRLPPEALLTDVEAGIVTQLTRSALAARRIKGRWTPFVKFGKSVRYRLGALLTAPNPNQR
jgi:hypothetical protein